MIVVNDVASIAIVTFTVPLAGTVPTVHVIFPGLTSVHPALDAAALNVPLLNVSLIVTLVAALTALKLFTWTV